METIVVNGTVIKFEPSFMGGRLAYVSITRIDGELVQPSYMVSVLESAILELVRERTD